VKATVAQLVQLPGVWRGGELEQAVHEVVATGHARLDAELPGGGWPMGTLSEVLHDGVGIGEVGFLSGALARAADGDRLIAWINPPHLPYAPAIAQAGIPLERCLVVRPENREDAMWAAEQALKSGACGAVLLWIGQVKDYAWLRRLQMAAEAGRAMAVYVIQGIWLGIAGAAGGVFLGYAAVLPEARGLGAGKALGETVLGWARDAGYAVIATDWRSTNLQADRSWRGLGFRPTFRRLHRYVAT